MKRRTAVLAGIGAAAFAQLLSFGIGGAGHGWIAPFFFSPIMWFTLPLMAARLVQRGAGSDKLPFVDGLMLLSALALDAALIGATRKEMFDIGPEQTNIVLSLQWPLISIWLVLWLSWQIAALFLLCTRARHQHV